MNIIARRILGSFRFPKFSTQPKSIPEDPPVVKKGEPARFIDAIKQPRPLKLK